MLIRNNQTSRTLENGEMIDKFAVFDTDTTEFCWRHGKDGSYKLIPSEIINKDKTVNKFRVCEKCKQVVEYTKEK